MTKLGKALFLTLGGMSPKLAADSALRGLVAKASKKNPVTADDLAPKVVAMDSELDPEKVKKAVAALLALDAEKEEKPAEDEDDDEMDGANDEEDETEEERKKKEAKDKKARDKKAKDEEKEKAMDAKIAAATEATRRELREADEARRLVQPIVGDVIAQDSAEGIYGFALDHLKVAREGVTGTAALKALFNVASQHSASPAPVVASDSAGAAAMFPGLSRFGRL